jgi:hypothetical protein
LKPEPESETTSHFIGATLTLTGQVYQFDESKNSSNELEEYTGSISISVYEQAKTGTVTDGQLNYSIDTPVFDDDFNFMLNEVFDIESLKSISISTSGVKGNVFWNFEATNDIFIFKGAYTNDTDEGVKFIYVDRDVRIRAKKEILDFDIKFTYLYFWKGSYSSQVFAK